MANALYGTFCEFHSRFQISVQTKMRKYVHASQ